MIPPTVLMLVVVWERTRPSVAAKNIWILLFATIEKRLDDPSHRFDVSCFVGEMVSPTVFSVVNRAKYNRKQ